MIGGNTLIGAALERTEIVAVLAADEIGHLGSVLIPGARDRVRRAHRMHGQGRSLACESLVDEHRRVFGVIDDEERRMIDEMRLPELGGDSHIVGAVACRELIAANLHPVFGLRHAGGILRVDAQAERRSPQEVGHELHPRPIVGKNPRTGSLEALLRDDRLIDGGIELGLGHAVRPDDARHVDARPRAETDVDRRAGDRLLLHEPSGSHFHFAADPEGVNPLIAGRTLRARSNDLMVIAARAPAGQTHGLPAGKSDEIELTITGEVDDTPNLRVRAGRKAAQGVILAGQPDAGPCRTRGDEIERPVVVEVGKNESRRLGTDPRSRLRPLDERLLTPVVSCQRRATDHTRRVERHEIERAIGVDVAERERR